MTKLFIYANLLIPFVMKIFIPDGRYGSLAIIADVIILPLTLAMLNIVILLNKFEVSIFRCFLFMLLGLLLGDITGYVIWGISSKNLLTPDAETLWIHEALLIYYAILSIISFAIAKIITITIHFFKNRRSK